MSSGDTAWVLISAALVLFMTPGLALFYGGMVRPKGVLAVMMLSFICMGIITVLWAVYGFSLSFGHDIGGGLLGGLHNLGLRNMTQPLSGFHGVHVSPMAIMVFQMMFAVVTPPSSAEARWTASGSWVSSSSSHFGSHWCTCLWPTGPSAPGDGWPNAACSTSPAVPWSRSTRGSPPWPSCWCSVSVGDGPGSRCNPTRYHSPCWEPASSGSVGSGSLPGPRWGPTVWQGAHSWT